MMVGIFITDCRENIVKQIWGDAMKESRLAGVSWVGNLREKK